MTPEFAQALCEAQAAGLVAVKDQTADLGERAGKYSYADLVAVWAAIRPVLTAAGIAVLQPIGTIRTEGTAMVFSVRTILLHRSGEILEETAEFPCPPMGARNQSQAYGSALTYARRYALCAALGIATGDDDDAARARRNDSSPDRDATPAASDTGHWSLLMDGNWAEVAAPEGGGSIGDLTTKQRETLVMKYPTHAGLTAWVADSRVLGRLHELGWGWDDFTAAAGGSWPDRLDHCDSAQVVAAASAAKALLAKGGSK